MLDLVNMPNNIKKEPTTNSLIIAKQLKRKHHSIASLIRKYKKDLQQFGSLEFEMRMTNKSKKGQGVKAYILNEDQAMLLFTYMTNYPKIRDFKIELIKAFRLAINELNKIKLERAKGITIRLTITDAIKEMIPESEHKKFKYITYTKLIYKVSLGKSTSQIRKERSIPKKANLRDHLSKIELEQVAKTEQLVTSLIEFGKDYQEIKSILL